jgi:uncharacterized protein (DUF983 family)
MTISPAESESDTPATRQPVGAQCGSPCPKCKQGIMDYNGVLDLECPVCGYTESSGAGCT